MNDTEQVVISFNDEGRQILLFNVYTLAKLTEVCINFEEVPYLRSMLAKVNQGLIDLGEMMEGRDTLEELRLS